MPLDSPLVRRAAEFAGRAHQGQVRKSREHPPYFVHLEAVAARIAEHGHEDDELLAAAYLHDVLEDQPAHADELRATFSPTVVAIVTLLTERKLDATARKRPKAERFADYLGALREDTPAAARAAIVSCADKLDNLTSLVAAQRAGDNLLCRLNTRPGQHVPQLTALRGIYAAHVGPSMLAAFDRTVAELRQTVEQWLPGRAVAIAAEAHLGHYDRAGHPYVYHPLRMLLAATTDDERMVSVLHDVVEDTPWTLTELLDEGFSPLVVAAIDALTRRPSEPYPTFLERVAADPLATRVMRLDLDDNLDRLEQFDEPHRSRLAEKYRVAAAHLAATSGPDDAQ